MNSVFWSFLQHVSWQRWCGFCIERQKGATLVSQVSVRFIDSQKNQMNDMQFIIQHYLVIYFSFFIFTLHNSTIHTNLCWHLVWTMDNTIFFFGFSSPLSPNFWIRATFILFHLIWECYWDQVNTFLFWLTIYLFVHNQHIMWQKWCKIWRP